MSRAVADPLILEQIVALSDQGLSHSQIGRRLGLTKSQVLGRLARARTKAERLRAAANWRGEGTPSVSLCETPPPLTRGEDNAPVGLVAGNTEERGAHLDALIWKRRSYFAQLRAEGGL